MMEKKATMYTDGGARGNPGPSAVGVVIKYDGQIKKYKDFIGIATNNQAEYKALILGLEKLKKLNIQTVDIYLDSLLVVEQLKQKYKVKDKNLAKLFVQVWNLALGFKKITYNHVPREQNKEADKLVNEAIDIAIK